MFGLQEPAPAPTLPPFPAGEQVLFVNARSAVYTLLDWLSCRRLWLPSYLCEALLPSPQLTAIEIRFYPVGRTLTIEDGPWLRQIERGDAAVLIDYFGLPLARPWVQAFRDRGAWVIEDAAQALLTRDIGQEADFTIYSPRKFVGVPDGGVLVIRNGAPAQARPVVEPPPNGWWSRALASAEMRTHYDRRGGHRAWFELYRAVEADAPVGCIAMSDFSRARLYEGFDYADIAERRIANYYTLSSLLAEIALYPSLGDGVVPIGFPVRLAHRDSVQRALFRHAVYPPVHWHLPAAVPAVYAESHRLSREILTLPCDQRYSARDMMRVAGLVRAELCR